MLLPGDYLVGVHDNEARAFFPLSVIATPTQVSPACGDGVVTPDEECDDRNHVAGDGCGVDCTLEVQTAGTACSNAPTLALAPVAAGAQASKYSTLSFATSDSSLTASCGQATSMSVYRLNVTAPSMLTVLGQGLAADVVLSVFSAPNCAALTEVGCANAAGPNVGETLNVSVDAGSYVVVVGVVTSGRPTGEIIIH